MNLQPSISSKSNLKCKKHLWRVQLPGLKQMSWLLGYPKGKEACKNILCFNLSKVSYSGSYELNKVESLVTFSCMDDKESFIIVLVVYSSYYAHAIEKLWWKLLGGMQLQQMWHLHFVARATRKLDVTYKGMMSVGCQLAQDSDFTALIDIHATSTIGCTA